MNPTTLITPDTIGAAFGILGTILLALNGPRAGWGFVAYLVSNAAWLTYASQTSQTPLLVQTLIFTGSSLLGVWVWLVKPRSKVAPGAVPKKCEHGNPFYCYLCTAGTGCGVVGITTGATAERPPIPPAPAKLPVRPAMTNSELCEAIQCAVTTIKRRRSGVPPVFHGLGEIEWDEAHLETLVEEQRMRALRIHFIDSTKPEAIHP